MADEEDISPREILHDLMHELEGDERLHVLFLLELSDEQCARIVLKLAALQMHEYHLEDLVQPDRTARAEAHRNST